MRFHTLSAASLSLLLISTPLSASAATADDTPLAQAQKEVMARYKQGDYRGALALGERSLADAEAKYGKDDPKLATLVANIGSLNRLMFDLDKAEQFYLRSLALQKQAGRTDPSTLTNLGELYTQRNRIPEARAMLERALSLFEAKEGKEGKSLPNVLNSLGNTYQSVQGNSKAEALHLRALAISEKVGDPKSEDVITSLLRLGEMYRIQDEPGKALPRLERARQIAEETLGTTHLETVQAWIDLGLVLADLERDEEARSLLRRGISQRERLLGPEHAELAEPLAALAQLELGEGKVDAALVKAKRSLNIVEKRWGPKSDSRLDPLIALTFGSYSQGNFEQTLEYGQQLLTILEVRTDYPPTDKVTVLSLVATAAGSLNQQPKLGRYAQQALDIIDQHPDVNFDEAVSVLLQLASSNITAKKPQDALSQYQRALILVTKQEGNDSIAKIVPINGISACLAMLGKMDEAETYFDKAQAMYAQSGNPDDPNKLLDQLEHAFVLEVYGRKAEADAQMKVAIKAMSSIPSIDNPISLQRLQAINIQMIKTKRFEEASLLGKQLNKAISATQ